MNHSYVTHLESALDGTRLPARTIQRTHRDRPLWVRYDLESIGRDFSRDDLNGRPAGLWRYRSLLPIEAEANIVSLGEGETPLLECRRVERELGVARLLIKDESRLPTGSFKARGMAVAVSVARELGLRRLAVPTAGNAGGALAAYAARAGLESYVFMPLDTPVVNRCEAVQHGARCFLVPGLISDCGKIVREGAQVMDWFDCSTLREPYRIEGKKTMGLELADQLGWSLPDVILYPTGGGTGLIGMWKAFHELRELGWLSSPTLPRLYACQSDGCAPIVDAFDRGERFSEPPRDPRTIASGLRVPRALGDFMILDAVRESGGRAVAGAETSIVPWMRRVGATEGICLCPESAICFDVLARELDRGSIRRDETIVIFNTGAAQKYVEVFEAVDVPVLDHRIPIDWSALE